MNFAFLKHAVVWGLLLSSACGETTATTAPVKENVKDVEQSITFDGLIVATNATKLRAPQNEFRVAGWNSSSSWIELSELAEDGAEVKKGDMIGRFKFRGNEALPKVQRNIARAEADRDQSSVSDADSKSKLIANVEKSLLDAQRAALDLQRGSTVSNRDLARFEITKQLAEFDADANTQYARAQDLARFAEKDFQDRKVDRAQADMDRFNMYKRRFVVSAPHDGVVRHGYHRRRNRKVQKGDGMPSGMHFASVSRDSNVAVDIYVPEKFYKLAKTTKSFVVKSPTSDEAHKVNVVGMEEFPQTLGFVKEDQRIPNAQTRVYIVKAVFETMPDEMSSGLEVKVRIP